jgi:type IV fimbrial biogenesis protein FimT
MSSQSGKGTQFGFTLIEMMITLSVIAILAGIVSPAMTTMVNNHAADTLKASLEGDIAYARSQAITLATIITLSPVNDDWSNGWQIRQGVTRLRQRGTASTPITESGYLSSSYTTASPLSFDAQGRANSGSFDIKVSGCQGEHQYNLSLNFIGQTVIKSGVCP